MAILAAVAALLASAAAAAEPAAWRVAGKNGGEVALLGSMHVLRESDYPLPALVDELYTRANVLVTFLYYGLSYDQSMRNMVEYELTPPAAPRT